MAINLHLPGKPEALKPTITVIGVGGAGGNAVNNMIAANLEGVNFVVANTDAQAMENSLTERRIQLGATLTRGLGAGANPEVGKHAAEEALEEIAGYIEGSNMVFITAGMGGGTGTGAAPVIARLAKDRGILTVGVITKPFQFEGLNRMRLADQGINELQQYVDTLIVIPNQNLFRIANEKTTFADAFRMADEVLHSGVRGVTDLMIMPGLINLDFADIRTVMSEMGKAMMGTGEGEGPKRAIDAAEAAISNPLLDDVSMKGAKGVLINITGSYDMTLFEADEAATRIREEVDPNANIIFGATFNPALEGKMRVSVVATGIDSGVAVEPKPQMKPAADLSRFSGKMGFNSPRTPEAVKYPVYTPTLRNTEQQPIVSPTPEPAKTVVATPTYVPPQPVASPQPVEKKIQTESYKPLALDINDATSPAFAYQIRTAIGAVKYQDEAEQMPVPVAVGASAGAGAQMRSTPSFISPPAMQPAQRSFFAMAEDGSESLRKTTNATPRRNVQGEPAGADTSSGAIGFLNRMASVGRAALNSKPEKPERSAQVVEKVKVETTSSPATKAATDNDYLEIPAFLRRQAN